MDSKRSGHTQLREDFSRHGFAGASVPSSDFQSQVDARRALKS
jgi:hypothetical protein